MNKLITGFFCAASMFVNAQFSFSVSSTNGFTITCQDPALHFSAASTASLVSYTWTGPGNFNQTGSTVSLSQPGIYTVSGMAGASQHSLTVAVHINTVQPVTASSSTFAVLNQTSATVFTFTAISPTVNLTHIVYTPLGGLHSTMGPLAIYSAAAPGTYTQCFTDNVNGCSSCGTFVVAPPGWPGTPGTSGLGEPDPLGELGALATHHGIRIWCGKPCEVFIYGIHGQELRRISLDGRSVIEIPLSPGIYFVGSPQSRTRARKVVVL